MNRAPRFAGQWGRRWNAGIFAGTAALIALVAAGGLFYVDRSGEALLSEQEREAVEAELDFMSEVQADEGDLGLVRTIARRARLEAQGRLYALADASGAIVAGNIARWPAGVGPEMGWRSVDDVGGVSDAHLATAPLGNGYVALIGRDNRAQAELRREILTAALTAVAVVAATSLVLGAIVTEAILARARRLSAVAMRVSSGDFGARATDVRDPGPFGDIARAQNAMLDRIENLVAGLRTVTDSLAHDLRTPLARLRSTLETAAAAEEPAAWRAGIDAALTQTDRT
ncbi:MAG: HAMP domain-containing protein, partial [Parvularculaceae bacterium]|nr:HAMP domain-containing protein [Parvularculaceae bacterium]